MKILKKIIFFIFLWPWPVVYAIGYEYQEHKTDGHVVHIVTINPNKYNMQLVKAQGARETVPSIAKRLKAKIAINGGFFNIGSNQDGLPTGSLVIEGKPYKVKNQTQALAIINSGIFSIQLTNTKDYVKKNNTTHYSLVSGIPLLVNQGQIVQSLFSKKGNFYTKPHARTAIGIKVDGTIVICVVEHPYKNKKDLTSITLADIQSLFSKKSKIHGEMTMNELKEILKSEFFVHHGAQGFTIIQLANFMKKLECEFAVNLDGGGSSTLWVEGKLKNHIMGDKDEGYGIQIVRPVSDAIVFHEKDKV